MFSLSAYAVSHKRSLLPQAAFFVFCIIEVTGILATEFVSQNLAFNMATYYEIPIPVLRIISGTGVIASLWVMLLDILDVYDRRMQVAPVTVFVLACCIVIWGFPYGPFRQWLFYTLRQVFTAFGLTYACLKWRRSTDMPYRERLGKLRSRYLFLWGLLACILLEDWWIILASPIPSPDSNWYTLYLSERNFSENVMMLFVAYHVIRGSLRTLALRFNAPPTATAAQPALGASPQAQQEPDKKTTDLKRHIEDALPAYASAHNLSKREREVLAMVIEGKDNRTIAQELFLSEGTIKTHVHNIMVKTETKSRNELKQSFWAS
jgi:DNA-binding CsgD family transcriptional regulator